MARRYRWKCPNCGAGKLLGKAPRKNATARFCLPCSEETGYLVERMCPCLEKERAEKAQKRAEKDKEKRAQATALRKAQKASEEARWMVQGHDLRKTIRDLCKLPFLRNRGCKVSTTAEKAILRLKFYSRTNSCVSGRAHYGTPISPGSIKLNTASEWARSYPSAWSLILHELLHAIGYKHGPAMTQAILICAKQTWGLDPGDFGYNGKGNFGTYNADTVAAKMARSALDRS